MRAAARWAAALISSTSARWGSSGAEVFEQELAVAGDDRQEVVEVVGDAAGQPADRLQLLGLPELLLEAPLLGHVLDETLDVLHLAVGATNRTGADPHGNAAPSRRFQTVSTSASSRCASAANSSARSSGSA